MSDRNTILVIGAGIAGLAAALALGRAGFPVIVAERRSRLEEEGAGIQLSPNASRILIDLGLGAALARRAVAPEGVDLRRFHDPRAFARVPLADARARYGAPFWTVLRADLHTVLLDAVRGLGSVRLLVGRRIVGFSERPDGLVARLANEQGAEERLEASVLVGADGVQSSLRGLAGETGPPFFRKAEAWRALLPRAAAPDFMMKPLVNLWMGPGAHLVHYPVAEGASVNVVLVRGAEKAREGWANAGDSAEIGAELALLAPAVREPLRKVGEWNVWSLFDRSPPHLARGRVAFVGDAAHPVLPFLAQGGALAIEDAAVLAGCMASGPGDPAVAIARYAALRLPRVRRVQEESRANARRYHMSGPFSWFRDAWIVRRGPERMLARLDWLYGWSP